MAQEQEIDPYFLRCEFCKHRGPTTHTNTCSGVKHECWCHLDGIPGPLHDLFGKACARYERRG